MESRPHSPCTLPVTHSASDALPPPQITSCALSPRGQPPAQVFFARVPRCLSHLRNINSNATVLQVGPRRCGVPGGAVHSAKGCCYPKSGLGTAGKPPGGWVSLGSSLCCSSASHCGMLVGTLSCVMPSDPGLGLTPLEMHVHGV